LTYESSGDPESTAATANTGCVEAVEAALGTANAAIDTMDKVAAAPMARRKRRRRLDISNSPLRVDVNGQSAPQSPALPLASDRGVAGRYSR
jgi:hypothetical protein